MAKAFSYQTNIEIRHLHSCKGNYLKWNLRFWIQEDDVGMPTEEKSIKNISYIYKVQPEWSGGQQSTAVSHGEYVIEVMLSGVYMTKLGGGSTLGHQVQKSRTIMRDNFSTLWSSNVQNCHIMVHWHLRPPFLLRLLVVDSKELEIPSCFVLMGHVPTY